MIKSSLLIVFGNPLAQIIVFCCLFFCGEVFCAPFIIVIRFAITTGDVFAIVGTIGLVLTLASLFTPRYALQGWGLAAMWVSLVMHLLGVARSARPALIQYPLQYIVLALFVFVTVMVILKLFVWKNS